MGRDCLVSIVDRNEIAREGLRRALAGRGFASVSTCSSPRELKSKLEHLIVIALHDHDEAVSACATVRRLHPAAHLVVLTQDCCADMVMEALEAGADGVLSRILPLPSLATSLELVILGEKLIPSSMVSDLRMMPRSSSSSIDPSLHDLSAREMSVLERIVAGRANKLISRDLGITEGTVKVHVKSILRKLGVSNRTQAAMWATGGGMPFTAIPSTVVPFVAASAQ